MPISISIIGAGGHGKVVADAVVRGCNEVQAVFDDNPILNGQEFYTGVVIKPVPTESHVLESAKVHLAIGNNLLRSGLAERCVALGATLISVVHPQAIVSEFSDIAAGCFVAAGAVVAPKSKVGVCAIINHGAVVDHDCHIGAYVHVAPNATLGGGVSVGNGSLIGAGAVVLPGITIGQNSVIGAGAVVTKSVADGARVIGVPGRTV